MRLRVFAAASLVVPSSRDARLLRRRQNRSLQTIRPLSEDDLLAAGEDFVDRAIDGGIPSGFSAGTGAPADPERRAGSGTSAGRPSRAGWRARRPSPVAGSH